MKKTLKLLPLLFVMPALSGFTTGPSNYYSEYHNLGIEYVSSELVDETYYHTFHLDNYGDGYVDRLKIRDLIDSETDTYNTMTLTSLNISPIFADVVIPPHSDMDIVLTSNEPIHDTTQVSYAAGAYKKTSGDYPLTHIKEIKFDHISTNESSPYKYIYKVVFLNDHYDLALFHINYDGKECYLTSEQSAYDHYIYTTEELDLSKLTFLDFSFIESHQAFKIDNDALNRGMIILIVGYLFLVSLIVFPAVFIPAMVRRKRRRNAANK